MMTELTFTDSKILVVGGAGFVGSNLVLMLLDKRPREIIIVDNFLSSDIGNIPTDPRVKLIFGSVTDDAILKTLPTDLDFAFHLACYHGNQSSIENPLADHENNTLTSLKLFELLKDCKTLKKVVYAAAGCAVAEKTFDGATATTEEAPVSLYHDSPYSISKLIGELYGNYYWQRSGMPLVKARFQNVYGPGEVLGAGRWRGTPHTVWRNVTPTFIWKALNHESLPLDNGGNVSRDFIFVEDIVRGLMACAQLGELGEAYNLASGVETDILSLANMVNEFAENPAPVDIKPARDWDRSGRRFGSTEKSKRELGFEARVTLREGLQQAVAWTRDNRARIAGCMAQHSYFMAQE